MKQIDENFSFDFGFIQKLDAKHHFVKIPGACIRRKLLRFYRAFNGFTELLAFYATQGGG